LLAYIQQLKLLLKKGKIMYYLFIGQLNTTFGSAHKVTGLMNTHGDLMSFDTLAKRNEFYKNAYSHSSGTSIVKTTEKQAKSRFFGGLTQWQYLEYINFIDSDMIDYYNRYNLNIAK
jgi:hypothetical protein